MPVADLASFQFSALLVGVDRGPPYDGSSTASCMRDVARLDRFFRDRVGVPGTRVEILSPPKATREGIEAAFRDLVAGAAEGSEVFFHFSGHGTTAPGDDGPERALVPYGEGPLLRATDLAKLVAEAIRSKERLKVTVVLDCGHSWTGTAPGSDASPRCVEAPADDDRPTIGWDVVAEAGATVLAACGEGEPAFEFACDGQHRVGVFSFWLLESLRQAGPGVTYREVFQRTVTKVRSQFMGQTPALFGDADREVLGTPPRPFSVRVAWVDYHRMRVRLANAPAETIAIGSRFVIVPQAATGCDGDLTEVEVIALPRTTPDDAIMGIPAKIRGLGSTPPRPGDRAILREPALVLVRRRVRLVGGAAGRWDLDAALLKKGEGFVEPVPDGEAADLLVKIAEAGHYVVADPAGTPLPGLEPVISPADEGSSEALVRRLVHVSRFLATLQLDNAEPLAIEPYQLDVELIPGPGAATTEATRFSPEELPPTLQANSWMIARVRNRGSVAVNVAMLSFRPGWAVSPVTPFRKDAGFWPLEPGAERERRLPLHVGLSDPRAESDWGVLKVIAATDPASLRWLELPPLDQPIPPRPTVVQGTLMRGAEGSDAFERFLASFAQAEHAPRFLGQWLAPPRNWAVVQVEVRVCIVAALDSPGQELALPPRDTVFELFRQGKYADAVEPAERALQEARERSATEPVEALRAINNLAMIRAKLADYEAAERLFDEALATWDGLGEAIEKSADLAAEKASLMNNSAALLRDTGRLEKAKARYEEVGALWERTFRDQHPDYAVCLMNLAAVEYIMGNLKAAEYHADRAAKVVESILGTEAPYYANCLSTLGTIAKARGDLAAARSYYDRASRVLVKTVGEEHPSFAIALQNQAVVERVVGDRALAVAMLDRALAIQSRTLGEDHPDYAASLSNKARFLQADGDVYEAYPLADQAARIRLDRLGSAHPEYAASLVQLAELAAARNDHEKAAVLFEDAISALVKSLGPRHSEVAQAKRYYAVLQYERGLMQESEKLFREALHIDQMLFGVDHPRLLPDLEGLVRMLQADGRPVEAADRLERVGRILAARLGDNHDLVRDARRRRDALRLGGNS